MAYAELEVGRRWLFWGEKAAWLLSAAFGGAEQEELGENSALKIELAFGPATSFFNKSTVTSISVCLLLSVLVNNSLSLVCKQTRISTGNP